MFTLVNTREGKEKNVNKIVINLINDTNKRNRHKIKPIKTSKIIKKELKAQGVNKLENVWEQKPYSEDPYKKLEIPI